VAANQQVFNPVAALDVDNNGVVLLMPKVTGLGAATANGELIFGINTQVNNQVLTATQVRLGVDWQHRPESYLNVTTQYDGQTIYNSYFDTGTNGLFFSDSATNSISKCPGAEWYCPTNLTTQTAILSDGDFPQQHRVTVQFDVGNASSMFSTTNSAFGELAGVPPGAVGTVGTSFSWGMPFFFGKRVVLSIWNPYATDSLFSSGPWYSWTLI
jgi:hypothetical protein